MTIDWAPKPKATPPMPAPAISGPRFTPISPRMISAVKPQIRATTTLRSTWPKVSARASALERSASSIRARPGPFSRSFCSRALPGVAAIRLVKRTMARLAMRATNQATSRMSAMRMGRSSSQSAAVANPPFSVHS